MEAVEQRRMCPQCRAFISPSDKVCPYCDAVLSTRSTERPSRGGTSLLGGFVPAARFTTMMILLINTALFAATVLITMRLGQEGALADVDGRVLLAFGAKYRYNVLYEHQWWRLITAGFLHGGLLHILMNSWVLFDLGAQVEDVFGVSRYLVIYIGSTITGFALSAYWSSSLSVGSSAGIFGLIGAMIALGIQNRSGMGDAIRAMYVRWAVYGLLFGLLPFFQVDNAAHIGGLAGGFLLAMAAGTPRLLTDSRERLWQAAAVFAVLLTVSAFGLMFWQFTRPAVGS